MKIFERIIKKTINKYIKNSHPREVTQTHYGRWLHENYPDQFISSEAARYHLKTYWPKYAKDKEIDIDKFKKKDRNLDRNAEDIIEENRYITENSRLRKELMSMSKQISLDREKFGNLNEYLQLTASPVKINAPNVKKGGNPNAVAMGFLSDIHFEERVYKEQVSGLNEYNPDIAKARITNFFHNFVRLVKKERQNANISTIMLVLLGDNITGWIHEELKKTNYMNPPEATLAIQEILMGGIDYIKDNLDFDQMIIPCIAGNHGRINPLKTFKNNQKESWEWFMYKQLQMFYQNDDKIKFVIADGELLYIPVYDYNLRFGHGDHFRYGGGVGGLTVPLIKHLYRANKQIFAHFSYYGHWHQLIKPTKDCSINGSVIGYNEYAHGLGLEYEKPQQLFQLIDEIRGQTGSFSIYLD